MSELSAIRTAQRSVLVTQKASVIQPLLAAAVTIAASSAITSYSAWTQI